jgi:hypothetical protein
VGRRCSGGWEGATQAAECVPELGSLEEGVGLYRELGRWPEWRVEGLGSGGIEGDGGGGMGWLKERGTRGMGSPRRGKSGGARIWCEGSR